MELEGQSVVRSATIGEADMPEDAEQYREAPQECIRAAHRFADDADAAAILLIMAQSFIELARPVGSWSPSRSKRATMGMTHDETHSRLDSFAD
jgi:hypothetical protein